MRCSTCGTQDDAGGKFCRECGALLPRSCPSCGSENDLRSKFCGECGAGLRPASMGRPAAGSRQPPPMGLPRPSSDAWFRSCSRISRASPRSPSIAIRKRCESF
ncbi:MAG: double zinc ribbon domain-containing protein [Actinomycetota bacterium]